MIRLAQIPRRFKFTLAILLSLLLHSLLLLLHTDLGKDLAKIIPDNVKIRIVDSRGTIEAKLKETEPPLRDAFKGQQNHRTDKETRLNPRNVAENPGADASAKSNKKKKSNAVTSKKGYGDLLPTNSDLEGGFNDFIPDSSIPVGEELDVNTTEYRYIGYVTAIRKSVEFAFYSPLSSLKDEPHVKEKIRLGEKLRYTGWTKARMTIEKSGLLSNVEIVDSQGDGAIDKAWAKILNLAAPFPPLPRHFTEEKFVITYTLYYDYVIRDEQKMRRFRF